MQNPTSTRRAWSVLVIAMLASVLVLSAPATAGAGAAGPVHSEAHGGWWWFPPLARGEVDVVSSRPDYVSGGDARVRVTLDSRRPVFNVRVTAGDTDVTDRFRWDRRNRSLEGVVDGLADGTTTIRATTTTWSWFRWRWVTTEIGSVDVTNYPAQGPMFSGPHQQPFICQTEAAGLGPALDDDCFAPTKVEYQYRTTAGEFAPLPAGRRPADLATTTTTTGRTVDYIVRVETGVINRAVYQTAVLFDPRNERFGTDSRRATRAWNKRIVYSYGGGCNAGFRQGTGNGSVLNDLHLSRGYATASSSLNVLDNNCNDVTSAETTSMVKERLIETYGADDHTIGWGGSGGAISQHMIGQNYPGLLDGIIPTLTYPDYSSNLGVFDCRALGMYADSDPSTPQLDLTGDLDRDDLTAIAGYFGFDNCEAWRFSFSDRSVADEGCPPVIPDELLWDAETNPGGVRCTITDHIVNLIGTDPDTGYAYTLFDNEGMQYGLQALENGEISVEQFLDVNQGIGGFDENGAWIGERSAADPVGLERAYAGGRVVSGGGGLTTMPIIDTRPYLDPFADIHTRFHSFSVRERLIATNGNADNQVIQVWSDFDAAQADALEQMDAWLDGIGADADERTAEQVVAAKPASLTDGCSLPDGTFVSEEASWRGDGVCADTYPSFGDPRTVAGEPVALDQIKCALTPPDRSAYQVEFTDGQWDRLVAMFATGTCDYSQPGVGQVPLAGTWLDYSRPGPDGAPTASPAR